MQSALSSDDVCIYHERRCKHRKGEAMRYYLPLPPFLLLFLALLACESKPCPPNTQKQCITQTILMPMRIGKVTVMHPMTTVVCHCEEVTP